MTLDNLVTALYPELPTQEFYKQRRALIKEIMKIFNISQPAIWKWQKTGEIPPARAIELVRYYKLDPNELLR